MNTGPSSPCLRMVLISDVSLGYGTPQLLRMAESFAAVFGAQVHILEPDESDRPPVDIRDHVSAPGVYLERIYTPGHPYWMQGRVEFCARAAERIRTLDPQVILFSTMYAIQVLDRLDAGGMLKIFYGLEDADVHYSYLFSLVRRCDVFIFPEENRRRLYSERLGIAGSGKRNLVVYNSNNRAEWTDPDERLRRIFYGGSFDRHNNFADYFLKSSVIGMPIDIYGVIKGFKNDAAVAGQLSGLNGGVSYCGYRQSDASFFELLSRYLYSIVIWNPYREDYLYACPNKLFDAIACGVPPIAAPHPQCVEILQKWNCGILMDDWSFESFRRALVSAFNAAGSDYYRELAANCRRARDEELSWDRQFGKLIPAVERFLAERGVDA